MQAGDFCRPPVLFFGVTNMADKTASTAKKQAAAMMAVVLAGVVAMTVIDLIIQPPYAVKSAACGVCLLRADYRRLPV